MSTVSLDTSPTTLLSALRGTIVTARVAYPDVLHVEVQDVEGGRWRLSTQDAQWSPADPAELAGRVVQGAEIDDVTSELRLMLSDGELAIVPEQCEASDDPPNWELITPHGALLEFGPGRRWQIASADAEREPPDLDATTSQNRELMRLLDEGLTDEDIAARLLVSAATVARNRARAVSKLSKPSRPETAADTGKPADR